MKLEDSDGNIIETGSFEAHVPFTIESPVPDFALEQTTKYVLTVDIHNAEGETEFDLPEQLVKAEAVLDSARLLCINNYGGVTRLNLLSASMGYLEAIAWYASQLSKEYTLAEVADILDELHNARLDKTVEYISPNADDETFKQFALDSHKIGDEKWTALLRSVPIDALEDDEPLDVHEAEITACLIEIARERLRYENTQVELAGESISDR